MCTVALHRDRANRGIWQCSSLLSSSFTILNFQSIADLRHQWRAFGRLRGEQCGFRAWSFSIHYSLFTILELFLLPGCAQATGNCIHGLQQLEQHPFRPGVIISLAQRTPIA